MIRLFRSIYGNGFKCCFLLIRFGGSVGNGGGERSPMLKKSYIYNWTRPPLK